MYVPYFKLECTEWKVTEFDWLSTIKTITPNTYICKMHNFLLPTIQNKYNYPRDKSYRNVTGTTISWKPVKQALNT